MIRGNPACPHGSSSMNDGLLGRLERVDLRTVWTSEPAGFTPWLGQPENLKILADTLGIDELELEAQEKEVGPFRADLLCKDTVTDEWVLVENQLERTDHTHLGQLLTYAAGLQAVTIVWLAERFTDEHRATLDWLNSITDESFRFFGLEIEIWRIGDSPAAPKFNMVARPNDWSRSVAHAARAIDDAELSETRVRQREYWGTLNGTLDAAAGQVKGNRKPGPRSWMSYPVGRTGFSLAACMNRSERYVRAELYIAGNDAKRIQGILKDQKDEIEQELGHSLEWEELPSKRDCRIACYLRDVDPEDESDWRRQHDWLASHLNDLHRVFSGRVRDL